MMKTIHKISLQTSASAEVIWQLWKNAQEWPSWDTELEWVTINGPFTEGQTGKLKPKGAPVSHFKITKCIRNKQFTDVASLPFSRLIFDHYLTVNNDKTIVTHQILIDGPFSWIFLKLLGPKLIIGLDQALPQLVKMAENNETEG